MAETAAPAKKSVEDYLAVIVPGVSAVDSEQIGTREIMRFTQQFAKLNRPARFSAESMSDGTLRAVGVLIAAFQPGPLTVIGVEEPESAIHPAAAAVLRDALHEASELRQVIVTTHSPELLDDPELDPAAVLAVESVGGETVVTRPEPAGLSALRDGLYTAGELLRVGQLLPETDQQ
jgi:predicted ATPase